MAFDTAIELSRFGVATTELLFLRADLPAATPYLDLVPSLRRPGLAGEAWPVAIVEGPFGPLAYVARSDQFDPLPTGRESQLRRLQQRLASRGTGAMLVVVSPGKLDVLPLGSGCSTAPVAEIPAAPSTLMFFRELAAGTLPAVLVGRTGWHGEDGTVAETLAALILAATRRNTVHVAMARMILG